MGRMKKAKESLATVDACIARVVELADLMDDILTLGMGHHIDRLLGLRPEVEIVAVFEEEKINILRRGNELNIWVAIAALTIWIPEMAYQWKQPLYTLGLVVCGSLIHQYSFMLLARRYPQALRFYFSLPDFWTLQSAWQKIYVVNSGWNMHSFYSLACWHRIIVICLVKESFAGSMMYLLLFGYMWATETMLDPEELSRVDSETFVFGLAAVFVVAVLIFSTLRAKILYCELAAAEAAKIDHLKTVFHFVSHEYRNHFFAGTMALDALHSNADLSPGAQRDVEILDRAHRNISALMENVLQMSQIDSGHENIWQGEAAPFSVSEDLVLMLRKYGEAVSGVHFGHKARDPRGAVEEHVRFEVQESHAVRTLPPVVGSVSLLLQAATNLVSNAIKFTPPGGLVTVTVDADPNAKPSMARLHVVVKDTGRGIPEEAHARIFEPFVQSCAGDALDLGGSGLGLSFTKKIIEAYDEGTVTLESGVGVGTTFYISILLPLHYEAEAEAPLSSEQVIQEEERQQSITFNVLVIDDSLTNRLMLRNFIRRKLEKDGLRVAIHEAADGASAVATVAAHAETPFHAITMDFHMPGEYDGVEATRRIRSLGYTGRIVGVTGEEDPKQMHLLLSAGCNTVWRKGGSLEQLLKELRLNSPTARERLLRNFASSMDSCPV